MGVRHHERGKPYPVYEPDVSVRRTNLWVLVGNIRPWENEHKTEHVVRVVAADTLQDVFLNAEELLCDGWGGKHDARERRIDLVSIERHPSGRSETVMVI